MKSEYYFPAIIIIVLICIIFLYYLNLCNQNRIEKFVDVEYDEELKMKMANQAMLPEPSIYVDAYNNTMDLSKVLKLNLQIDPMSRDIDPLTKQFYNRLLVPIHITTTLDNKCLAVFNDGKLYKKNNLYEDELWIGPLPNSLYGSQEFGIGMRMVMFFPINNNQQREVILLGVGADNCL
jgi:hypothetical protein